MFQYSLEISKNIPKRLLLLQEAISQEDPEKIKQAAHSVKGATALISFNELARLGSIIDANCNKDPKILQKVFNKMEEEWKLLEPIIEKEIKE
jgi:HPt (histidine-containing phosphotransfer) domain-containing protein